MKKTIILLTVIVGFTANAQSWNLTGNAGTNPGTNFLGTSDNQSIVFKTNNVEKLKITPNGRFVFFNVTGAGQLFDKNLFFGGGVESSSAILNTVFGMGAFTQNTIGAGNTSIGANVMSLATSGDANTAIGSGAMRNTQTAKLSVAVGSNALENLISGEGNVGVGVAAMGSETLIGNNNVSVGNSAARYLKNGNENVIVGGNAFRALRTGSNNINLGASNANLILSGNNNIFIGSNIVPYSSTPDNELNIGNWIVGNNGTIGIGQFTNQLPGDGIAADGQKYKLFVKDGIRTEKVKVDIASSNGWADYVFEKDYKLMSLNELDQFISKNGHLPEVPTTKEAIENGIELKAMNILLLKKVEELTLHAIEQQKRIEVLESKFK
ncbi:hypothetical protein [Chryseobacterium sp. ERMR1:04]|uniref:hypothetical protein n=1 Tax=Chryseobacterium sp. ERMR1:04 TaxID=1705393 RepID=UPI0006C85A68|nr:hypothetical protein [Chryseobacterium sp. ERMR1:04]KPH12876.1 hypothetical protein AMQ68_14580 [Chryseobacterium sp. ERMR1:04]